MCITMLDARSDLAHVGIKVYYLRLRRLGYCPEIARSIVLKALGLKPIVDKFKY
jgi:hypothetical protein